MSGPYQQMNRAIFLISCPDERGLIYRITGNFIQKGFNIVESQEFVDETAKYFFMRLDVESASSFDTIELRQQLIEILPAGAVVTIRVPSLMNIVVYTSTEPHCLGELLFRCSYGNLGARVIAVLSQKEECSQLAKRFGVPFHYVPIAGLTREQHEKKMLELTYEYNPELLVLARYMRVLTSSFVDCFPNRILNIHHSFLPSFVGKKPYEEAYERGVKMIGATAHYVNHVLDDGPIVSQSTLPVRHCHDSRAMAKLGEEIERQVLARALSLILESRVVVHGRRTVVFER